MKKWVAFLLLALCGFTHLSYAEIVNSIDVKGNSRLDKETIIQYLPFTKGQDPSIEQVDGAVKSLLNIGVFSEAEITSNGAGAYLVHVKENPIVTKIFFEGNDRHEDEELMSEITLKKGEMLTQARIKSSISRLQSLYQKSGRYGAQIDPKMIEKEDNRVDVVFEILEGDIIYIEDISFIGNKAFSDSDLRSVITSKEDRFWRFFSSNSTYDEDRLALDKSQLVSYYKDRGFVDFIIEAATAEMTYDKKSFILKFVLHEGRRYEIDDIQINDELTDIPQDEIAYFFRQEIGDYFSQKNVTKTEEELVLFLSEKGYPFLDVRGDIKRNDDDHVTLTYNIRESAPEYVNNINIKGNMRTLDRVILRKLAIAERDPLNRSLVEKSKRDLRGTGYFSQVDFTERFGAEPGAVDIDVNVEEQSTGDVTFGLGYSTNDRALAEISLSERNFLGRGQNVRVRASTSGRREQLDLGFTEPYLFGRDLAGGFDVFHTVSNFSREASFEEQNTGLVLRTGFLAAENLTLRPRYKINYDKIENLNTNASAIARDAADRGGLLSSSVGYEAIYDRRNDIIVPTKGYMFRFNQDVAGLGGDVRAFKTVASGHYFYTPAEDYTFSFELEGGAVLPFGGYDLRILDRHLIGGGSFRGFEVAGVGPRYIPSSADENDDAVGGRYFSVLRSELSIPLPGLEDLGMSGALFNDTGSLWGLKNIPSSLNGAIQNDFEIRSSVGFGLKWRSPVGPIRLDFSYPFMKQEYDRTEVFRFTAGSQF